MQQIEQLHHKLDLLLESYDKIQTEHKQLKSRHSAQEEKILRLEKELKQAQMEKMKAGTKVLDDKTRNSYQLQIDLAINEVDKILNTLHE